MKTRTKIQTSGPAGTQHESAWAFIGGFCAYEVGTKTSCAGLDLSCQMYPCVGLETFVRRDPHLITVLFVAEGIENPNTAINWPSWSA